MGLAALAACQGVGLGDGLIGPDMNPRDAVAPSDGTARPDAAAGDSPADAATGPVADAGSGGGIGGAPPDFVDDFETGTLDGRWRVKGFEGNQGPQPTTAVIETGLVHGGQRALHVKDGFIETAPPATQFYGRAWVYFGADPGDGHWIAWLAVGPGSNPQGVEVRYGGHYDILQANYFGNDDEVISDPKGYCSPTCANGVPPPVGRWACVETFFGKDEIRIWLDEQEIPTLHVTSWRNQAAPWSPPYDRVRFGFHNFGGAAVDVWYDDVALGKERIGCQ